MSGLSHFDASGKAAMVDVTAKPESLRTAIAAGEVRMRPETLALIAAGRAEKGDVLGTARLAGIMAAKRTHELIPLCHPLPIGAISLDLACNNDRQCVEIKATVTLMARTGAEMEALTAVSVAALTIYDMVKAVDRGMRIGEIRLLHKSGGKSGTWEASS